MNEGMLIKRIIQTLALSFCVPGFFFLHRGIDFALRSIVDSPAATHD